MSPMSSVKRSCLITEPACLETCHWLAASFHRAMADSGMLRGEFPNFPELLARISQLEEQCNAIARSLA